MCAVISFLIFAVPSASAQITETSEVLPTGETRTVQTVITENGDTTVTTERLIAADGCSEDVTTTLKTLVPNSQPAVPVETYENRGGSLPAVPPTPVTNVSTAQNALICSPPLSLDEPDEVLGETILAVTGSDIDLPIALGAALIGSGGLLVAASKRRRSTKS